LQAIVRRATSTRRDIFRAQIILQAADGLINQAIAAKHKTRPATVSKWRSRFLARRLAGLGDALRSRKPARYDAGAERRILRQLDGPPPAGYARRNGALLAAALQDISDDQNWRVLRSHGISLQRRRSWCVSTDPCFAQKAGDMVGLYLNPPENAIVLSVDEKPHIQALEHAQGWLLAAQWQSPERLFPRLQAVRDHHAVCGSATRDWQGGPITSFGSESPAGSEAGNQIVSLAPGIRGAPAAPRLPRQNYIRRRPMVDLGVFKFGSTLCKSMGVEVAAHSAQYPRSG
jgi:transposase